MSILGGPKKTRPLVAQPQLSALGEASNSRGWRLRFRILVTEYQQQAFLRSKEEDEEEEDEEEGDEEEGDEEGGQKEEEQTIIEGKSYIL